MAVRIPGARAGLGSRTPDAEQEAGLGPMWGEQELPRAVVCPQRCPVPSLEASSSPSSSEGSVS